MPKESNARRPFELVAHEQTSRVPSEIIIPAGLNVNTKTFFKPLQETLEHLLERLIEPLIISDIALFKQSNLLYRNLSENRLGRPVLEQVISVLGSAPDILALPQHDAEQSISRKEALGNYCHIILKPIDTRHPWRRVWDAAQEELVMGLPALCARHPLLYRVIDQTTENYIQCINECLLRVAGDQDALRRCFLDPDKPVLLEKIVPTRGEGHRQGRRALFLDFQVAKKITRVVYKPNDLEIDYRLFGSNQGEIGDFLQQHSTEIEYATAHISLCEYLNQDVFAALNAEKAESYAQTKGAPSTPEFQKAYARAMSELTLKTYKVLPRNPVSKLVEGQTVQLLDNCYGYLEYLEYEPSLPTTKPVFIPEVVRWVKKKFTSAKSMESTDWITEDPTTAHRVFEVWGRLCMAVFIFLQNDAHQENQRITAKQPTLIDLEGCLTKTRPANLTSIGLPTGLSVFERKEAYQQWSLPKSGPELLDTVARGKYGLMANQIFVNKRTGTKESYWATSRPVPPGDTVSVSLKSYLYTGAEQAARQMWQFRQELRAWRAGSHISDCLVRHVPKGTNDFAAPLRYLTQKVTERDRNIVEDTETVLNAVVDAFLEKMFCADRKEWNAQDKNPNNRFYLLNIPDGHGPDYRNLEVPTYYARANQQDIINSAGAILTDLEEPEQPPRAHYFERELPLLLTESLDDNLPNAGEAAEAEFNARLDLLMASLGPNPAAVVG